MWILKFQFNHEKLYYSKIINVRTEILFGSGITKNNTSVNNVLFNFIATTI
jgi:hypothetical protein